MLIHEYEKNTEGRDLFVGDLHGMYDQLIGQLTMINFNFVFDRLFCVGDMIDRGSDSLKCLGLIEEPWFFPILGNHEQMMLDHIARNGDKEVDPSERMFARDIWYQNGGQWYFNLAPEMKLRADKLATKMNDELPNGIQVGAIGMVHAECMLDDWEMFKLDSGSMLREAAMWARNRINYYNTSIVKNIEAIVVGHTPVNECQVLGNHVYIDSGAVFNYNPLTIMSYDEILAVVNK